MGPSPGLDLLPRNVASLHGRLGTQGSKSMTMLRWVAAREPPLALHHHHCSSQAKLHVRLPPLPLYPVTLPRALPVPISSRRATYSSLPSSTEPLRHPACVRVTTVTSLCAACRKIGPHWKVPHDTYTYMG
jgi:hypothetical protein